MTLKDISIPCSNSKLLEQAFTHKSYFVENQSRSFGDNEKLEFLGDAVLDLIVSDLLLEHFPNETEGDLSQRRSGLVNESTLAEVAKQINLGDQILLGKGEKATGGALKSSILASAFEAVIGAVFLSEGYLVAKNFVKHFILDKLQSSHPVAKNSEDFKTRLQEWVQKKHKTVPIYEVVSESGLDHEKTFKVVVKILGQVKGEGEGKSKKLAEQAAACRALKELENDL